QRAARAAQRPGARPIEDVGRLGPVALDRVLEALAERDDVADARLAGAPLAGLAAPDGGEHVRVDELRAADRLEVLLEDLDDRVGALVRRDRIAGPHH